MTQIALTTGVGVKHPQGRRLVVSADEAPVSAVCRAIADLPSREESWLAGAVFRGDYRSIDRWDAQHLLLEDGDYRDEDGRHVPMPDDVREQLEFAVESGLIPGSFVYLTPRGFRVGLVMLEAITDPREASRVLRALADAVDAALDELGLSCIRIDRSALDLARLMFTPTARVNGVQREADIFVLSEELQEVSRWARAKTGSAQECPSPSPNGRSKPEPVPSFLDEALEHVEGVDDYARWTEVGMALREAFGDEAFENWCRWSERSDKWPGTEAAWDKWQSFNRGEGPKHGWGYVERLAREGGWSRIEAFAATTPPVDESDGSLVVVRLCDVEPREIDWLWKDRIPVGQVSLIAAPPGAGKSYLTCWMASLVSRGAPWPGGGPCIAGGVVMISCEDDPNVTIRPRMDAVGADTSRVTLVKGVRRVNPRTQTKSVTLFTLAEVAGLERLLAANRDIRLVVIDPVGSYFGSGPGRDSNTDTEVRAVLAPLAELARRYKVAIVLVAHTRKAISGSADDMVLGSRAFTGVARAVHHVFRDPENRARRLLLPGKSNLGPEQPGLAFRLIGHPLPNVVFDERPARETADQMIARMSRRGGGTAQNAPKGATTEWLETLLNEAEQMPAVEVKRQATAAGMSWRTVQKAARDLGIRPRRNGFADGGWIWELPEKDDDEEIEELLS